ncbi:MAG: phosphopantothenoylcysteine decarboxylase, partial [Verrucomicrobiota bacterium]
LLVGFAAETEDLLKNATEKLNRKQCDLLIANDVSRKDIGFDGDNNEVRLFFANGSSRLLKKAPKTEIARLLFEEIEELAPQA